MIALVLSLALGADATTYDALIAAGEESKQKQIQQKETQIADYMRTSRDAPKVKGIKIRQMRQELDAFKASKTFVPPELTHPLKVGSIGSFHATGCKVLQVVSPSEMLGTMYYVTDTSRVVGNRVINGSERNDVLVWFRGIDAAGMANDSIQQMTDVYEVAGTKTYTTAAGASNTVMLLKPFDLPAFEAYRRKKATR